MKFSEEEIKELKSITPSVSYAPEGGYDYLLLEGLVLPTGCKPESVDALLCSVPRDGYQSRLFFSSQVTGCPSRNWNGNIRVLSRNWFAVSWKVLPGLKLAEMLMIHLNALREP
jgi:hypothetical protein